MKRASAILMAGALLASGSTNAKDYGDAGTIELGGNLSFVSASSKTEDKDINFKTDNSSTDVSLEPEISYFLIGGLPLFVGLDVGMNSSKDNEADTTEDTTGFGLNLGTGYLLKIGKARLGPAISLGFSQETTKVDDGTNETERTRSGPGVTVAGLAKLPIGSGGVITAGLFVENKMHTEKIKDVDGEADITTLSFGTSIGVSVFF